MATEAETEAALDALLTTPRSFTVDGMQVTNNSATDIIALDNHRSKRSGNAFGFSMRPLKPPVH